MLRSISLLLLVSSFFTSAANASENMNAIAQSQATMNKVTAYIQELREKRATQTVEEIMSEKFAVIDENMAVIASTGEVSDEDIEVLRMKAYSQLAKFEGIEDSVVLAEMEIAELQKVMTSENFMFMFTQLNLAWYGASFNGACGGPFGTRQGCVFLTVLCTPFAIVGDIVMLPFTFIASSVTGF